MVNQTVFSGILILCAILNGNPVLATSLPEHLEATVNLSSGSVVRVNIETITYSRSTPQIQAIRWGADDSPDLRPPHRIISSMSVYLGNKKLMLRLSAISDLCDPRTLAVKAVKHGFEIRITGREYVATIFYEGEKMRRRKVVSITAPKYAWEETNYHSDFPADW